MKINLAEQLPACLAEDVFLGRFIGIFDEVADTVEMQVANLENLIDVAVAPPQMVQWLGHFWLDVYLLDPTMDIDRRRHWVREMGRLLWLRGTAEGLEGLLEQVTGRQVEVYDSGGVYPAGGAPHNPHHVEVWVDDNGYTSDEHLLATVHRELPAEVTFELQVGTRIVWPRPTNGGPPPEPEVVDEAPVPRKASMDFGDEFHVGGVHHAGHHHAEHHAEHHHGEHHHAEDGSG